MRIYKSKGVYIYRYISGNLQTSSAACSNKGKAYLHCSLYMEYSKIFSAGINNNAPQLPKLKKIDINEHRMSAIKNLNITDGLW